MKAKKANKDFIILQSFSKNLSDIIEKRGLSKRDVARALETHESNITNWTKAKATPNIIWAVKLADFLKISLDELCDREPLVSKKALID